MASRLSISVNWTRYFAMLSAGSVQSTTSAWHEMRWPPRGHPLSGGTFANFLVQYRSPQLQ
jgi:hypothetical protein